MTQRSGARARRRAGSGAAFEETSRSQIDLPNSVLDLKPDDLLLAGLAAQCRSPSVRA